MSDVNDTVCGTCQAARRVRIAERFISRSDGALSSVDIVRKSLLEADI
jgi:hypothetical protein